jgi:peptide/nickel transport system substrate-binding protein
MHSGNYDVAITGIKIIPDAAGDLGIYDSGNMTDLNVAGYSNPKVDNLIKSIHNVKRDNISLIQNSFWQLKEILNDELPYFGLYFYVDAIAFGQNVKGVKSPDPFGLYDDAETWYFGGVN